MFTAPLARDDEFLPVIHIALMRAALGAETHLRGGGLRSVMLRGDAGQGLWRIAHGSGISRASPITCGFTPNFVPE